MALITESRPGDGMRTPAGATGAAFSFPYRRFDAAGAGRAGGRRLRFTVTLTPGGGLPAADTLRAAAAFLVDAVHGAVPAATLARMIGHYCYGAGAEAEALTVSLACTRGGDAADQTTVRIERPVFEVEHTGFGAAHILHEDDILGLYILEIAPHREIPAHCHRVMRESELILDDGLLQQERPVAPGAAFAWPLEHVHAYRNPTGRARRILCIDSPRFMPGDEVALIPAPPLVPLAPLGNYLA